MSLSLMAASSLAGRLVSRVGPGPVLTAGMTLIGTGMLLFSSMPADGTWAANVLAPSLITAVGIGFSFVPVTIAAVAGGAREEAGLASGLVNTSRQVGGSLGLAVLATLAGSRTADVADGARAGAEALTSGFDLAFSVGGGAGCARAASARRARPRTRSRRPR